MRLLRHYQLDVIFLFFALGSLLWATLYALNYFNIEATKYEWFMGAPLIIFYVVHLLHIRRNIRAADRRQVTPKSLVYWIALGCILFASYDTPLPAGKFWSINLLFVIFTLLLADSYWDFKRLNLDTVLNRQA